MLESYDIRLVLVEELPQFLVGVGDCHRDVDRQFASGRHHELRVAEYRILVSDVGRQAGDFL